MLSFARRRFTFANVALTIALLFAMTGGAFAAGKFLITSTKQIKPSVLTSLKGKAGPAGAAGTQGPAGPAGPQGPTGPGGAAGAKGELGPEGKEGKAGKDGKNGTTGFTETLPAGKTEQGTWATVFAPGVAHVIPEGVISISFNIPLSAALATTECDSGTSTPPAACQIHLIKENGKELVGTDNEVTASSACPGPGQAAAGNLCIYAEDEHGNNLFASSPVVKTPGGVVLVLSNPNEEGAGEPDSGSWAVTAEE
jgi:hypothetical protein